MGSHEDVSQCLHVFSSVLRGAYITDHVFFALHSPMHNGTWDMCGESEEACEVQRILTVNEAAYGQQMIRVSSLDNWSSRPAMAVVPISHRMFR